MIVLTFLLSIILIVATAHKTASSCGAVLSLECGEGEMMVVHEAAFTPHRGGAEECERKIGENRSSTERHNNRSFINNYSTPSLRHTKYITNIS